MDQARGHRRAPAPDNAEHLFALAEENTAYQLAAIVRKEPRRVGTRSVLLRFTPAEYERFAYAVLQHGARATGRGLRDQEQALLNLIASALGSSADDVGGRTRAGRRVKP